MNNHDAEIEFEAVLDTLVDGVIIINDVGIMRLFNPACTKIFGYAPDEVIGKNVKMLMPNPFKAEHDGYLKSYNQTGEKKIIGIGREVKGLRKDGSIFPMDLAVGETRVESSAIYVGIIRDLTARHEQQKKYDQLQEDHFHLARVSAMNEMGSAIAHELNQPMGASINYLETVKLLLQHSDEVDKEKILQITSLAIEQTYRASEIISKMRGFIEKGEVEKKAVSLQEVVETARRLTLLSSGNQNITMTVDISEDLPKVFGNNIQIQQVLVNLMKNACEAMMDSDEKQLEIKAVKASTGPHIEVQVSDTGHGLTDEGMKTLFVPFSAKLSAGMGVGLSISQSIVNHHGGQIWARQNKPKGSVFHFTLPIAERA